MKTRLDKTKEYNTTEPLTKEQFDELCGLAEKANFVSSVVKIYYGGTVDRFCICDTNYFPSERVIPHYDIEYTYEEMKLALENEAKSSKTGVITNWDEVEVGDKIRHKIWATDMFKIFVSHHKKQICYSGKRGFSLSEKNEDWLFYQEPEEKRYLWIIQYGNFAPYIPNDFYTLEGLKIAYSGYKILNRLEAQPEPDWEE